MKARLPYRITRRELTRMRGLLQRAQGPEATDEPAVREWFASMTEQERRQWRVRALHLRRLVDATLRQWRVQQRARRTKA